jgi:hypothetical protein
MVGVALLLVAAVPARASPYWVEYDASSGNFPEDEGWTRQTLYGGAERWFEDDALVIDSRANPGICDWVEMYRPGAMDPVSGETFVIQWRLKVDEVVPEGYYDVGVVVSSDEAWRVGFEFGADFVRSVYENKLLATYSPGVCHDFELVSPDMRNYALYVDSDQPVTGVFLHLIGPSKISWGDGIQGVSSLTRWQEFAFGVVPEPSCLPAFLVVMTLCRSVVRSRRKQKEDFKCREL